MTLLSQQTGPCPPTSVRCPFRELAVQLIVMGFPRRETTNLTRTSCCCFLRPQDRPSQGDTPTINLRGQMHNIRGKAAAHANEEYGCAVGFPGRNNHRGARWSPPTGPSYRPPAALGLIHWAVQSSRKATCSFGKETGLPGKVGGRG